MEESGNFAGICIFFPGIDTAQKWILQKKKVSRLPHWQ
jgi:hypothetical protein